MSDYPVPDIYEGKEAEAMRRHYFNVGRVAVEVATLEENLAELVWQVGGASGGQEDLAALASDSLKLEQGMKRQASGGGPFASDLARLLERYKYFRHQRNTAAHSSVVTTFGEDASTLELSMHHPKTNRLYKLPSIADVDVLVGEISEVSHEAYLLGHQVVAARMKATA